MPRFSICIPTRERHQTLPYTMRSVLQQSCGDFELIVQDNCSGPETRAVVESFDDDRIVYHRSTERLAMHDNWEQALDLSRGEFVIYLGDDDALLPDCLEKVVGCVEGREVDLLAWLAHTYYWPDVPDEKRRNHLSLDMRAAPSWADHFSPEKDAIDRAGHHATLPPGVFCLDSRRLLRNWLAHDGARVYVPTYHNLVSRRVIDEVKRRTNGIYFFNPLPDFGTLIANLYVAREVFFYAAPLSMTGHSGRSSGGTHGDQESWDRTLKRFMAEAKLTPEQLLPTVFDTFIWTPALLAGCFENVKKQLFPDDPELKMGWESFLRSAAAQVNGEPEAVRESCRNWVLDSAERIGMDPASIAFPEVQPWKRNVGTLVDPRGRLKGIGVDGASLGLETIIDAVSIACQCAPRTLYPTHIPRAAAETRQIERSQIKIETLSRKLKSATAEARQTAAQVAKLEAATTRSIARKDARIAKLEGKIARLGERMNGARNGTGEDRSHPTKEGKRALGKKRIGRPLGRLLRLLSG